MGLMYHPFSLLPLYPRPGHPASLSLATRASEDPSQTSEAQARGPLPTFEEAVLAVHTDNVPAQQAGRAAELAVAPVEPPIGAAHRHVAGSAHLQTVAQGLPCCPIEQAPAPVAAEFLPAGGRQPRAGKTCGCTQTQRVSSGLEKKSCKQSMLLF